MADDSNRALARPDEDRFPERLVAEVLLNPRRRYVLYYLSEHSGSVSVENLAVQVASWERAATSPERQSPAEATAERAESVAASLRETDLPHLDELGLVTYDDRDDLVTGRIDDPALELYLTNDPRTTVAWHRVYLALTAVSTVLVGLTRVGVPPFGGLDPVGVAGIVVALFATASLAYWYDVRRWRRRTRDEPPDFIVSLDEDVPFEESDGNGTGDGSEMGDESGTDDENETSDGNRTEGENESDDRDGPNDESETGGGSGTDDGTGTDDDRPDGNA